MPYLRNTSLYVLSLGLILNAFSAVTAQDCNPYQKYINHTMCIYSPSACPGFTLIARGLNEVQMFEVVAYHNNLRQAIVRGAIKEAPRAQSMNKLVWDKELAEIAQRVADQCMFQHDQERNVANSERFSPGVGQNIFMSTRRPPNPDPRPNMTEAIFSWFNEVFNPGFPPRNISPFRPVDGALHYTQMVWADTRAIGCGYAMWLDNGWSSKIIYCNYGPTGNIIGRTMYSVAKKN